MRLSTTVSLLTVLAAVPCGAQSPRRTVPEGWRWQSDRPAPVVAEENIPDGAWRVVEMIPGMHVTTTGPSVSLIAPGDPASGRFIVDAEIVLFPSSANTGYGILLGARPSSQTPNEIAGEWVSFLVAGDGTYSVVRRAAGETTTVVARTAHAAVVKKGAEPVVNRLRVIAERDSLRLLVNGTRVGSVARGNADGHIGLRVENGMNLHVTNVDLARRLLKAP